MTRPRTRLASQSWSSHLVYRVFRSIICWSTIAFTRMTIVGKEHLPPSGAYVLAPVHRSYVDTPIAACVTTRRLRFMGKKEMWKYRPAGWLFSALGAFPVDRGSADREALSRCIEVLAAGEPLVLFPEGERKAGATIQPLFDGAVYVAFRAGVPIVPVGIGGSAAVMPRHATLPRPAKVVVVIGEPILAEVGASGRASRSAIKEVTRRLSDDLQRCFDLADSRRR